MDAGVGDSLALLAVPTLVLLAFLAVLWRATRFRHVDIAPVGDGPPDEPYRVFTREFDLELTAAQALATLDSASPDRSKGWLQPDDSLWESWVERTRVMLRDGGTQDDEQLSSLVERLAEAGQPVAAADICVALLVDQSGSMKGEPIQHAAVSAVFLVRFLASFGASSEVLGFSTAGWQGGKAYRQWQRSGRPDRPGRLCALRHVIYKSADEADLSEQSLAAMVHPDLLRENVDGEAILWARDRLMARPEPHKLLIVVSDGAPVDDVTLLHNGPAFLYRHLMKVLRDVQDEGVQMGAIGIRHRVEEYYPVAETVQQVEDVREAGLRLLQKLFVSLAARAQEAC